MAFCTETRGIRCARASHDPLQSGSDGGRRGDPHQEHRVDAIQASIQGLGTVRSPRTTSTCGGKASRVRIADQRADLHARGRQLRENLAADVAGSSNDEDAFHASTILSAVANPVEAYNVEGGPALQGRPMKACIGLLAGIALSCVLGAAPNRSFAGSMAAILPREMDVVTWTRKGTSTSW